MFTSQNVSHFRCPVSGVRCQVSGVRCIFFSSFFLSSFLQSGEASRYRVCYQRGLPRLVSSNFLILSTGVPRRRSLPKIAARWRYRLPSNHLTAHYNSQFCVSFHFGCPGNPKMPLNVSELGLNII